MSEFPKPIDLAHRVLDIETTAIDTAILARAVLAQHEEIERLRSLAMSADEALEIEGESDTDHRAVARKLAGEVRQLRALLADARECIADRGQLVADRMQLRAALTEALDAWWNWLPRSTSPAADRIAELRKLVTRIAELRKLVTP